MQRVCLQVPQHSESSQGEELRLELVERIQPDLMEMTGFGEQELNARSRQKSEVRKLF
jgi:hypothetical protein